MKSLLIIAIFGLITCIYGAKLSNIYDDENNIDVGVRKEINFDRELQKLNLTTLRTLLKQAGLFDLLSNVSLSHTVFAPTDEAFRKVPTSVLENPKKLKEILSYHVHNGSFLTDKISNDMILKTLLGGRQKIRFNIYNGATYCSCQPFGNTVDDTYYNGVLQMLGGVMLPPENDVVNYIGGSNFTIFGKYVDKAGLQGLFTEKMTLLAPNDAAFQKLPADVKDKLDADFSFLVQVMKLHGLPDVICAVGFIDGEIVNTFAKSSLSVHIKDGNIFFNNVTKIIQKDTMVYNGVVHNIDGVLLPDSNRLEV